MGSNEQIVRQWLQKVLTHYPSSDMATNDTMNALARYPTLSPKTDSYIYESGRTNLLLQLHGTIPITYRTNTYHIPLAIWFPLEYPRKAPMVYVTPTKDMAVRKSKEVEPGGRVGGQILDGWESKWEAQSLPVLLEHLQDLFSTQPPVYAKQSQPEPRPMPPQPAEAGPSGTSGHPQPFPARQPPPIERPRSVVSVENGVRIEPLPLYTSGPQPPPLPQSPIRARQQSSTPPPPPVPPHPHAFSPQRAFSQPRPHPPPPHPGHSPHPTPHEQSYLADPQFLRRSSPGQFQDPRAYQTHPTLPPPNGQPPAPPNPPRPWSPQIQPQYVTPPTQPSYMAPRPGPPPNHSQIRSPPLPRPAPATPIRDLLSSDDTTEVDPAPTGPAPSRPLPPSTLHLHSLLLSHLQSRIPPLLSNLQQTTQQLLSVQADLASGEPAIKDEMARLETVRDVCASVGDKVGAKVREGEGRVADIEGRGEIGVDEVVCGISIVHNQLIDLVAEDNAIEDTIYHLARALDSEKVDLDKFLKQIRILGREQYQKRALIERIQNMMGAGGGGS